MTIEYRALSADEVEEWQSGHQVWPGAVETTEGVLVPLDGLVVTGHFWNGETRETYTTPLEDWRGGMPAGNVRELLETGATKRGWSDFHLHHRDGCLPEPRWVQNI